VVTAARTVPGNTADAKARRDSGLIVLHRRRPGHPLFEGEEEKNAQHCKVRAPVEHTFSRRLPATR
jgi:hypothetical protein